jgi:hypothetical protein
VADEALAVGHGRSPVDCRRSGTPRDQLDHVGHPIVPAAFVQRTLRAVQALVGRVLVSIPPSKVRFTFVDPVALGESFAAFMHLGDEFEQLVGERIWTEPRAIEQRLVDISEHMETVIQKYLRNEFEDIDAYNEAAGEIAEPYRFLVCADFPANFSEQAAARMLSILRAGQRCGVHVILLREKATAVRKAVSLRTRPGAVRDVLANAHFEKLFAFE